MVALGGIGTSGRDRGRCGSGENLPAIIVFLSSPVHSLSSSSARNDFGERSTANDHQYYAHLITLHPTLQETATDAQSGTSNPFGGSVDHDSADITMAEAAAKEWELFEAILRDVLRQRQRA